jgi:glycosyltransferase involved in cell wall biosynthesis
VRVLSVLPGIGARAGGVAAFVGGSALGLRQLGVEVTVVTTDLALVPVGWVQRQRRISPAEWHPALVDADTRVYPARFPRRLARSPELRQAVRATVAEFDVVHIHNLWQMPQRVAFRAALERGVPYVVSPHGGFDPFLRQRGKLRKRIAGVLWQDEMLERAARLHVTTAEEQSLIADIAPAVPRAIVPCGIDAGEFTDLPPREEFRHRHLRGYQGAVILFLGRLTAKKGVDVLIRAFARVREREECRLVIVGPDDERLTPRLRRLIARLGLDAEVDLLGPTYGEERLAALATADVWALCSHTENFGIAVVEAMAAESAVVISPAVNLADDIAAAGAGVIAPADPEAFAEALLAVLGDDAKRAHLRAAARQFAAGYDWGVVSPRLLDMYRDVVEAAS